MLRKVIGVITGYAIFVVTSLALFKLSGQDPHSDATTGFIILTLIYGIVFSLLAGYIARRIINTKSLVAIYVLAFIIAGFATFSFFKSTGNHWTQILAIFIFAPTAILGGLFYNKRQKK